MKTPPFAPSAEHDEYSVIGLMSGTSLDGLDIAFCHFRKEESGWTSRVRAAETVPYSEAWRTTLSTLEKGSALDFVKADIEYGHLLGKLSREFIDRHQVAPEFIASHGHTIFHQPRQRITSQIGRGSAIAAETGLPVVCDFRSLDVALSGQGAPLVPIGDELLFGTFDFCLNIGGFANISLREMNRRVAYDVCPANIVMNALSARLGFAYDPEGSLAAAGQIDQPLLSALNALPFYMQPAPKSLGKEWVVENIFPMLESMDSSVNDLLATFCEHIAMQVAAASGVNQGVQMLITGGGAFNKFLVERIRHHAAASIYLPDPLTINFKEALIFAFLGVLRLRGEVNCLQSVTGAYASSSSGAIY